MPQRLGHLLTASFGAAMLENTRMDGHLSEAGPHGSTAASAATATTCPGTWTDGGAANTRSASRHAAGLLAGMRPRACSEVLPRGPQPLRAPSDRPSSHAPSSASATANFGSVSDDKPASRPLTGASAPGSATGTAAARYPPEAPVLGFAFGLGFGSSFGCSHGLVSTSSPGGGMNSLGGGMNSLGGGYSSTAGAMCSNVPESNELLMHSAGGSGGDGCRTAHAAGLPMAPQVDLPPAKVLPAAARSDVLAAEAAVTAAAQLRISLRSAPQQHGAPTCDVAASAPATESSVAPKGSPEHVKLAAMTCVAPVMQAAVAAAATPAAVATATPAAVAEVRWSPAAPAALHLGEQKVSGEVHGLVNMCRGELYRDKGMSTTGDLDPGDSAVASAAEPPGMQETVLSGGDLGADVRSVVPDALAHFAAGDQATAGVPTSRSCGEVEVESLPPIAVGTGASAAPAPVAVLAAVTAAEAIAESTGSSGSGGIPALRQRPVGLMERRSPVRRWLESVSSGSDDDAEGEADEGGGSGQQQQQQAGAMKRCSSSHDPTNAGRTGHRAPAMALSPLPGSARSSCPHVRPSTLQRRQLQPPPPPQHENLQPRHAASPQPTMNSQIRVLPAADAATEPTGTAGTIGGTAVQADEAAALHRTGSRGVVSLGTDAFEPGGYDTTGTCTSGGRSASGRAVERYGALLMASAGWRCTAMYDIHDALLLSKLAERRERNVSAPSQLPPAPPQGPLQVLQQPQQLQQHELQQRRHHRARLSVASFGPNSPECSTDTVAAVQTGGVGQCTEALDTWRGVWDERVKAPPGTCHAQEGGETPAYMWKTCDTDWGLSDGLTDTAVPVPIAIPGDCVEVPVGASSGPAIGRQGCAASPMAPNAAAAEAAAAPLATAGRSTCPHCSSPVSSLEPWSGEEVRSVEDAAAATAVRNFALATAPAAALHPPSVARTVRSADPKAAASRSTFSGLLALLGRGGGGGGGGSRWHQGNHMQTGEQPGWLQLREEASGREPGGASRRSTPWHGRHLRAPAWLALAVGSRAGECSAAVRASEPACVSVSSPSDRAGAGGAGAHAGALRVSGTMSPEATDPVCSASSTASLRPPRCPPPPHQHYDEERASSTTSAVIRHRRRAASLNQLLLPLKLLSRSLTPGRALAPASPPAFSDSPAPPLPRAQSHLVVQLPQTPDVPQSALDREMRTAMAIRGRAASVTGIWLPEAGEDGSLGATTRMHSPGVRSRTSTPGVERSLLRLRGFLQEATENQQPTVAVAATAAAASAARQLGAWRGGSGGGGAVGGGGVWEARLDALMREQLTGGRPAARSYFGTGASWNTGSGPAMSCSNSSSRVSRSSRVLAASLRRLMGRNGSEAAESVSEPQPDAGPVSHHGRGDGISFPVPPQPRQPAPPSPAFRLHSGSTRGISLASFGSRGDGRRGCHKRGSSDFGAQVALDNRHRHGLAARDAVASGSSDHAYSTAAAPSPVCCGEPMAPLPPPLSPPTRPPPPPPLQAASMPSAGSRSALQQLLSTNPSSCGTGFGGTYRTSKSGSWQRGSNTSSIMGAAGGATSPFRTSNTSSYMCTHPRDGQWVAEYSPATAAGTATAIEGTDAAAAAGASGLVPTWLRSARNLAPAAASVTGADVGEDRRGGCYLPPADAVLGGACREESCAGGDGRGGSSRAPVHLGEPEDPVKAAGELPADGVSHEGVSVRFAPALTSLKSGTDGQAEDGVGGGLQGEAPQSGPVFLVHESSGVGCPTREREGSGGARGQQAQQPQSPRLQHSPLDPCVVREVDSADELDLISFRLPCPLYPAAAAAAASAATSLAGNCMGSGASAVPAAGSSRAELGAPVAATASAWAGEGPVLAPKVEAAGPEAHTVTLPRVTQIPDEEPRGGPASGEVRGSSPGRGAARAGGSALRRWMRFLVERVSKGKRRGKVGPAMPAAAGVTAQPDQTAIRDIPSFGPSRVGGLTHGSLEDCGSGRAALEAECGTQRRESRSPWRLRREVAAASGALCCHGGGADESGECSYTLQGVPPVGTTAAAAAAAADSAPAAQGSTREVGPTSGPGRLVSFISTLSASGGRTGAGAGFGSSWRSAATFPRFMSSCNTPCVASVATPPRQSMAGLPSASGAPSPGAAAGTEAASGAAFPVAAALGVQTGGAGSAVGALRGACDSISGVNYPRDTEARGGGSGTPFRSGGGGSSRRSKSLSSLLQRQPPTPSTPPQQPQSQTQRQSQQPQRRTKGFSTSGVGRLPESGPGGARGADGRVGGRGRSGAGVEVTRGGLPDWGGGTRGRQDGDGSQRALAQARLALLAPLAAAVLSPPVYDT